MPHDIEIQTGHIKITARLGPHGARDSRGFDETVVFTKPQTFPLGYEAQIDAGETKAGKTLNIDG